MAGDVDPRTLRRKRDELLKMPPGLGLTTQFTQHTGHMPVGVGILRLLPQDTLERGQGELRFIQFGKHAAKAGSGTEVLWVEFDGGVVPFTGRGQIAGPIEEFGQHEGHVCGGALGLKNGPQRLGSLHILASCLEIVGQVEDLGHDVAPGKRPANFLLSHTRPDQFALAMFKHQDSRILRLVSRHRRRLDDLGIEAQVELASCTEQQAVAGDREPTAVHHHPALGHRGGRAGSLEQTRKLGIDLTKRQPGRQQCRKPATYHELAEVEPLERAGSLHHIEQSGSDPMADRRGRNTEQIGHHRRRGEPPHTRALLWQLGIGLVAILSRLRATSRTPPAAAL